MKIKNNNWKVICDKDVGFRNLLSTFCLHHPCSQQTHFLFTQKLICLSILLTIRTSNTIDLIKYVDLKIELMSWYAILSFKDRITLD